MTKFQRRGVKWNNNTLLLLFVFFIVGLFLHYGGQPQPVLQFWEDVKSIFTTSSSSDREKDNPYRSPEPDQPGTTTDKQSQEDDNVATDNRKSQKPLPDFDRGTSEGSTVEAGSMEELTRIIRQRDFVLPALERNDQIVRHTGYALKYVERYEQAAWVAYELPGTQVKGNQERENTFYDDPSVKSGSAVHADYTRSGYDRGHLAPAADFKNNRVMMKESFYMSNISPQAPDFNRGIWSDLEQLVRVWAIRYKKVYVVTGPVLKPGLPTIGRLNKVAVPEQYYKVILAVTPPTVKGIAFLMRNEGSTQPLSSFVVSIDEVEKVTGIDFFPRLPNAIQDQVEAQSNQGDWYRLR
ncbi:DNA/RNA non-specific endonuclease [Telluribacter sp. SYSU D00476]|uniref:DNA/RNA non-specific endonuclease n=1 Tax=Telluribacter sp. SYSU D00476 TaxID=2811430 RepID=UPI001FF3A8A8|nr:DNA/RNA non-specific endonuclease [Telluribacter sp. SYSU D00476]